MASTSAQRAARLALQRTSSEGIRNLRPKLAKEGQTSKHRFRVIDCKGEVLGRLAAQISQLLQGKDKPTFDRSKSDGDICVVINANMIGVSGRKMEQKKFYRHTGYVGGLVERTAREMHERDQTFLIRKAVERMLPDNQLRKEMLRKLRVFPGEEHAFEDCELVKFEMPKRALKKSDEEDAFRANVEDGFEPFNSEKREILNKRFAKSIEAKKEWRMGQRGKQWIDLDSKNE